MNSTVYLFGKFDQGITASVNDYTKRFFEVFISKANAPTQIIIHRDGNIMNYGYVRKIERSCVFGICVQINGQYISTTNKLFEVFENIVAQIAVRGDILQLNRKGNLENTISNFVTNSEAVERAIVNCQNEFSRLSVACRLLPDIDFSTAGTDVNYFKESDNSNTIIKSSVKNGYTFIYKEDDYDTVALGGYRSTLSALNKENETYKKLLGEQEHKLKILERKKKRMGAVVALFVTLFLGSILFYNTIEEKNQDINNREQTIDELRVENQAIAETNKKIEKENVDLQGRNHELEVKLESTNQELYTIRQKYEKLQKNLVVLAQENDNNIAEISSLTRKNSSLEQKLKQLETDLKNKNNEYKNLQKKNAQISAQLIEMENKYYSTKEGKKELKR